jgi:signal transduction histidine kinase
LSVELQTAFFRAAQEGLRNVIRHAQASSAQITLSAKRRRISMSIEDDGIGIADAAFGKPGSLGLISIDERFRALGGGMAVKKAKSRGTVLTAYVPLGK